MHRIDTPHAEVDANGPGKDGFNDGEPGVLGATELDAQMMNAVQEELAAVPEGVGLALVKTDKGQVARALRAMFGRLQASNVETLNATLGADVYAHAFDGSRLVAVGISAAIETSDDFGLSWTSRTAGGGYTGHLLAITYSPDLDLFVAVGASGGIQTSPDGTTWTQRTAAAAYAGSFRAAAWSEDLNLFVIAGDTGEIQTSPDGTTWTQRTAAAAYAGSFRGAVWTGTAFVLCGTVGCIQRSINGTAWTDEGPGGVARNLNSAAADSERGVLVVAGSDTGTLRTLAYRSVDDGSTWALQASGDFAGSAVSVAFGGVFAMTVANSDVITLASSGDGQTWKQHAQLDTGATLADLRGSYVGDRFVVIGYVTADGFIARGPAFDLDIF